MWNYLYRNQDEEEIAHLFYVCGKTVRRTVDLCLKTGDVETQGHKRGPKPHLSDVQLSGLLQIVFECPGAYLDELQVKFRENYGVHVSVAQICATVHKLGLTRQKIRFIVARQSEEQRAEFSNRINIIPASRFVFVDETGCNQRDVNREYAYGIRGMTPINAMLPKGAPSGQRISAIAAMSTRGVEDFYVVPYSWNMFRIVSFQF